MAKKNTTKLKIAATTTDSTPAQKAKAPKEKAKANAKPKRVSAIDAAAKVLGENGQPMNCKEMIDAMAAKAYWTTPGGKTPSATLYTAVTMVPKWPPRGGFSKRAG
jgi:hypothetical protein